MDPAPYVEYLNGEHNFTAADYGSQFVSNVSLTSTDYKQAQSAVLVLALLLPVDASERSPAFLKATFAFFLKCILLLIIFVGACKLGWIWCQC